MTAYLDIRDLTKRYGPTVALEGVSLQVERGELKVLLGPSGSGKSTILKMIAGLLVPTSGRVLLQGKDITYIPIHQRNIGLVMQGYSLFPHLTAFENVAFPLCTPIHRCSRPELQKRVAHMFELTGLEGVENRKPSELSGGQQQRVALARALVFDPDVLLLDEPIAALDRDLREKMQEEIRRIHRVTGTTIVYVTHDQSEAMMVADRIAILNGGRIAQAGSGAELYDTPQNAFVAQFLGGANLMSGHVDSVEDSILWVRVGNSQVRAPANGSVRTGTPVTLMVRPDRVRIGSPDADSNRLPGKVMDMAYLGSSVQTVVSLGDGTVWRSNMAPETSCLQVGTETHLYWRPEDTRMLPAGQEQLTSQLEDHRE